ncbi:sialidase family protein [Martelella endophytica]|uniref:Sialidase domain-containing protein n=1 Tax=Martelella endophytica TaxID=1486262 RepID=A0A0D5LVR5_MAREN|nr:exo-alpha-sialidase [Martelella endophytica]AJY47468.1 hypothetical protein TM49_20220 [Martelella endophytica]
MFTARLKSRSFIVPQGHDLFNNCHASTVVVLPDGTRLIAFFGGEREGADDVAIWTVRGDGEAWHPPRRLFAEHGLAHWNPVLLNEGNTVYLFYKVGPTVHDWVTRWSVSDDGGLTWSTPAELVPGDKAPRGPVKNKLLVMSNGGWLAPASIEAGKLWDAFVDISADKGKTWSRVDIPFTHREAGKAGEAGGVWSGLADNALWETDPAKVFSWDGVIQPSAWESAPGHIHLMMRSTRGFIYRSDSADFGQTWSEAYPTSVVNNNSGIDLADAGGVLALVYNPNGGNWGRRSPLSVALSTDNGGAFHQVLDLETEEGEFSYPAIIAREKELHVTYTHNRKSIVYCHLSLEDG